MNEGKVFRTIYFKNAPLGKFHSFKDFRFGYMDLLEYV